MTLYKVDSIWLSDSPETDCQDCQLRYFQECRVCKKMTCIWCGDDQVRNSGVICLECACKENLDSSEKCHLKREDNTPCGMALPCPRHTIGIINTGNPSERKS
jgi:hypothetical protein